VSYDTGDKALQCGRHNDVFKLWLMWRAKVRHSSRMSSECQGTLGFGASIDRLMELAQYFTAKIKRTPGYEMVIDKVAYRNPPTVTRAQPQFLNVCFWYVPPSLRHLETAEKMARLDKIAPKIKGRMMAKGAGYCSARGLL